MKGSDYSRVEKAIRFLTRNVESQPSLAELAEFLGLSEFHSHRLFKKWAGITPKDFLQLITLSKAKALLRESQSTLKTSAHVGLSGTSRLHDLFIRYEAMTPGQYKAGGSGIEIHWDHFDSPLGKIALAATDQGICSLAFPENAQQALAELKEHWPRARIRREPGKILPLAREITARVSGKKQVELSLVLKGTPFQVKVWEALLRIPEGSVTTYQDVAKAIGAPRATRAVGTAVGANPIGFLIPCHRVIRSTGAIGDYHWGATRKTAILAVEYARSGRPS
jgi:AraC family transcriptional regulator of adaptative response/methylated-DNA-[protein]-cysteine methyltransferase